MPNVDDKLYSNAVDTHLNVYWKRVFEAWLLQEKTVFFVEPEHGPFPYQQLPTPIDNQHQFIWQMNGKVAKMIQALFDEVVKEIE